MNEHADHISVLPIVFAANGKFSIPLILAIESLLKVAGPASVYEVHVMDDGISSLAKDYLISLQDRFNYTITFHDVSQLAGGMPTTYYFPKVTYARFLLSQFFAGTSHRRVFYSDADVFFARDIAPVYNMDMQGCPLAGVQELNCLPPVIRRKCSSANINYVEDWAARFGILDNIHRGFYANAGTVLMDIKEFEEGGYAQRCLDECSKIDLEKAPLLDQDVLNYVCWGRIALLSPIYGAIPMYEKFYSGQEYYPQTCKYSLAELAEGNNNPAIILFAGQKPRVLEGARFPLEEAFIDFWRKSAWRDYMPYSPRVGSLSPSRFIEQNVPISSQLGILRKELLKYTVASWLPLPKRRHYAEQRKGIRLVLENARSGAPRSGTNDGKLNIVNRMCRRFLSNTIVRSKACAGRSGRPRRFALLLAAVVVLLVGLCCFCGSGMFCQVKAAIYMKYFFPVPNGEDAHRFYGAATAAEGMIAHGGGIGPYTYANSVEALQDSLQKGFLFVELDLLETSDGHLVAAHDWKDLRSRAGSPATDEPLSLDQVLKIKREGRCNPLTAPEICAMLRENANWILVTDKISNYHLLLKEIPMPDRMIVEIPYGLAAYAKAIKAGVRYPALTLWDDELYNFVLEKHIPIVTVNAGAFMNSPGGVEKVLRLHQAGIAVFMFCFTGDAYWDQSDFLSSHLGSTFSKVYTDRWSPAMPPHASSVK